MKDKDRKRLLGYGINEEELNHFERLHEAWMIRFTGLTSPQVVAAMGLVKAGVTPKMYTKFIKSVDLKKSAKKGKLVLK